MGIILLALAIAAPRYVVVNKKLGPDAITALESFVQTDACPGVDVDLGLSGANVCSASKHSRVVVFDWVRDPENPTVTRFTTVVRIPGSRTIGAVVIDEPRDVPIKKELAAAAALSLNVFVDNQLCPIVNKEFKFPSGTCSAADHAERMRFTWDRSVDPLVVKVSASIRLPDGAWTPGAPQ